MTTATLIPAATPPAADYGPYRLSLLQYDRLIASGGLGEHDPVFLLHGLLVAKMPRDLDHIDATHKLYKQLERVAPAGWYAAKDDPIGLPDGPEGCASAPEPDGAIIVGEGPAVYRRRRARPGPGDVALVAEVANTSLAADRRVMACHAFAGIPIAWIVNLVGRVVEVYEDPTGPGAGANARYNTQYVVGEAGSVRVVIGGVEIGRIPVADILPEPAADGPGREGG